MPKKTILSPELIRLMARFYQTLEQHAKDAELAANNLERDVQDSIEDSRWMTTTEAAESLGVSERTVRRRAALLGGEQVGGTWRFLREKVEPDAS